jgi:hypothetical protein
MIYKRPTKVQTTIRYHLTSIRIPKNKKQKITSAGEDMEKLEFWCTTGKIITWCHYYEGRSSKNSN